MHTKEKFRHYFSLVLILVVSACGNPNNATHPSAPTFTASSAFTSTLESTNTPVVTPTSMNHAQSNFMGSCSEIVDAKNNKDGIFQVVFATDDERSAGLIYSEFGYLDDAQHTGLALWSEETQQTLSYPLPENILGPKISSDHRWILFRRDVNGNQSEFWVVGTDGKNEKRIGVARLDQGIKNRYPHGNFSLNYAWISNTHKFFYRVEVTSGQTPPWIIDEFVLADADSGTAMTVPIPSDAFLFAFAPDGRQMAVTTENELLMFDVHNGQMQYSIPVALNNPIYSPDGKYLIDFSNEGIRRIDAGNGEQVNIPLKYTVMVCCLGGEGPTPRPLPNYQWVDNSTLMIASLESDNPFVIRSTETDPSSWKFHIWKIDFATGETTPSSKFSGDPETVIFSADGSHIAFTNLETDSQPRRPSELYLANVFSGEVFDTLKPVNGKLPEFLTWFPDSEQFIYLQDTGVRTLVEEKIRELRIGETGQQSIIIGNVEGSLPKVNWLSSDQFSMQFGICIIAGYETINLISLRPAIQIVRIESY